MTVTISVRGLVIYSSSDVVVEAGSVVSSISDTGVVVSSVKDTEPPVCSLSKPEGVVVDSSEDSSAVVSGDSLDSDYSLVSVLELVLESAPVDSLSDEISPSLSIIKSSQRLVSPTMADD